MSFTVLTRIYKIILIPPLQTKSFQLVVKESTCRKHFPDWLWNKLQMCNKSNCAVSFMTLNYPCKEYVAAGCRPPTSSSPTNTHKHTSTILFLPRHQVWEEMTYLPFLRVPLCSKSSKLPLCFTHNEKFHLFIFQPRQLSVGDKVHLSQGFWLCRVSLGKRG